MDELLYSTASLAEYAVIYDPFKTVNLQSWNLCLADFELSLEAFQAHRTNQLKVHKTLIQELNCVDSSNADSTHPHYFRSTSSQFQPLANVSQQAVTSMSEIEEARSYLDVMTPSSTTAGYATIGDILTRQVEDSIDSSEVDVVNVVDDEPLYPPPKKAKLESTEQLKMKGKLLGDFVVDDVSPFYLVSIQMFF